MGDLQQNADDAPSTPSQPPFGERLGDVSLANAAREFTLQAQKLAHQSPEVDPDSAIAIQAKFITSQDPIIVTSDGSRLPAVPLEEAHKLNVLKEELAAHLHLSERDIERGIDAKYLPDGLGDGETRPVEVSNHHTTAKVVQNSGDGSLRRSMPPSHTNPLFPPLPLYGPPSFMRNIQSLTFRASSFFLGAQFLGVIMLGALFTSIPPLCGRTFKRLTFQDPDKQRPFYEEEKRRKRVRKQEARAWVEQGKGRAAVRVDSENLNGHLGEDECVPLEGGPDPIVCDAAYYARRVGLDIEAFSVQTEDGFLIDLWHVYNPKEYVPLPAAERAARGPDLFTGFKPTRLPKHPSRKKRFPVLLMHGLLQSAGAYCVNDDSSLAFYLCKSGFDVWLGNNRCGFSPKHVKLDYSDPRMWAWNIRQMGVFDLPALVSRVRYETGFDRIGLVAHSQGTTQTFVALAKEQRPELGEKLTVFCALAPAAYAGPLIGKMYFKFMRVISPAMFRLMFGIHAFLPIMMTMHARLNARLYGWLGYKVFSFLFDWTDTRWDRELKNRMFQFAPVFVSAESMRWWLGRECFARHKCILATKEEWRAEEREDEQDHHRNEEAKGSEISSSVLTSPGPPGRASDGPHPHRRRPKGSTAWYDARAPPFAMWVCGNDDLVDGRRLLRRFERGREPHVRVVHTKVIPGYEHLDVIWAMDAPDQVFRELREVLWKTCGSKAREECRVPVGCEDVGPPEPRMGTQMNSPDMDQTSSGEDLSV